MHFHLADAYQETGSLLHRMDARVKIVLAPLMILLIGLTPAGAFGAYVGFFALVMAGAVVGRVSPWAVVRRSFVALPFAAAAVTLIFTVPGRSLGVVPLLGLPVSEAGLIRFASIIFKSMVSVQVAVLLVLSTHFTDMVWAMGALRVPRVLVAIISFMYRYAFVMADEALRLTRARDSRSAVIGGNPLRGRSAWFNASTTGRLIGSLFLRSFERSERVYQAMVARGYQGQIKRLSPPPLTFRDVVLAAVPLLAGIALTVAASLWS